MFVKEVLLTTVRLEKKNLYLMIISFVKQFYIQFKKNCSSLHLMKDCDNE